MSRRRPPTSNIFSVPGSEDLLSLTPAVGQTQARPANPTLTLNGVDLGVEWLGESRDSSGRFSSPISYIDGKQSQQNIGRPSGGAAERIDYTLEVVPFDDGTPMLFPKGMPTCTFKHRTMEGQRGNYVVTTPHANTLMYMAARDHRNKKELLNNEMADQRHNTFAGYLERFGEEALWHIHGLRVRLGPSYDLTKKLGKYYQDLMEYFEMASEHEFCHLTQYGVWSRQQYTGLALNDTTSDTLPDEDWQLKGENPTNYCTVVLAVKKNAEAKNIFGTLADVPTQSNVHIVLKRVFNPVTRKFEHFAYEPGSSGHYGVPFQCEIYYRDPAGNDVRGMCYALGQVLRPPASQTSDAVRENANNTGFDKNTASAFDSFSMVPKLDLLLGF